MEGSFVTLKTYQNGAAKIAKVLAIAMTVFHVYTCTFGLLTPLLQRSIHIGFAMVLIFLLAVVKAEKPLAVIINSILALAAFVSYLYLSINHENLLFHAASPNIYETVFGVLAVVIVILAVKKSLGWALPIIAGLFILYALFGNYLTGAIAHRGYTIKRLASQLTMNTEGIFGMVAGTSATYIFLFCLFGCLLEATGCSKFFMDFAIAIAGKKRGGAAKIACVSSGLFGMMSGSAVANVMTTGTFTIPLMKKGGYPPEFAGAVEAVSSTGGQIMPPIMGAAAFIIAETLSIPYAKVAAAALLPAVLYYVAVWIIVDIRAQKSHISGAEQYSEIPKLKTILKEDGFLAVPFLALILFLAVLQWSPLRSGLYSCAIAVIVSFFNKDKEKRFSLKMLMDVFENTAYSVLDVAAVCACAGIIIGTLSLTGLGIKFSSLLVTLAGGHKILLLVFAAIAGIILGMGMTTTTVYIILSVLVCPALVEMGVTPLVAHLFVFYFGILSNITPPVATASFAAASLAQCNAFKLGFTAWKIGLSGYILPFMFVYGNELCLIGEPIMIIKAVITSFFGIYCLCCGLEAYYKKKLNVVQVVMMLAAALLLIDSGTLTDIIGVVLAACVLVPNFIASKKAAVKA